MDTDWAYLEKFRVENSLLKIQLEENRIVFIGDSIIAGWNNEALFTENQHFINRGINGQTTSQILHRFQSDVIDLKPKFAVILVGTNDIAENLGPITMEQIQNNFTLMIEIAKVNAIKVIICSILPAYRYYWNPKIKPVEKIIILNVFLISLSNNINVFYLDFYTSLEKENAMNKIFSEDGVHPNSVGYNLMSDILRKANYF